MGPSHSDTSQDEKSTFSKILDNFRQSNPFQNLTPKKGGFIMTKLEMINKIKYYNQNMGITYKDMAENIGITPAQLYTFLKNNSPYKRVTHLISEWL